MTLYIEYFYQMKSDKFGRCCLHGESRYLTIALAEREVYVSKLGVLRFLLSVI